MRALYERRRPQRPQDLNGKARTAAKGLLRLAATRCQLSALIAGPSGSGKSTVAAMVADRLAGGNLMNIIRLNVGAQGGIDFVRQIQSGLRLAPWCDAWKVYLLEEAHNLTPAAQQAFLDLTENYPDRRAFLFTSTREAAIVPALRSRLVTVRLSPLSRPDLSAIVRSAAQAEEISIDAAGVEAIVRAAQGNARQALNALEWYGIAGDLPQAPTPKPKPKTDRSAAARKAWATRRARARASA